MSGSEAVDARDVENAQHQSADSQVTGVQSTTSQSTTTDNGVDGAPGSGAAAAVPSSVASPDPGFGGGHEAPGFVHPSSYLRLRGQTRPITPASPMGSFGQSYDLTAVDREQMEGLVSVTSSTFSATVMFASGLFCFTHRSCSPFRFCYHEERTLPSPIG